MKKNKVFQKITAESRLLTASLLLLFIGILIKHMPCLQNTIIYGIFLLACVIYAVSTIILLVLQIIIDITIYCIKKRGQSNE